MAIAVMAFDLLDEKDVDSLLKESTPQRPPLLRCCDCGHGITDPGSRMERGGRHDHHVENPLGITFHIGCFSDAPGCTAIGQATEEHSWFRGYGWRVAVCQRCRRHLGWQFQSSAEQFFGLILSSLTESN